MISCTVILAVCILYIDLVWKIIGDILECSQSIIHWILLFAAISSHGCINRNHFDGSFDCHFKSFYLLLFWTTGDGEFWANGKLFILQFKLVWFTAQVTKVHRYDDFKYAEAHLLSWIWGRFAEPEDVHSSKNFLLRNVSIVSSCCSCVFFPVTQAGCYLLPDVQSSHGTKMNDNKHMEIIFKISLEFDLLQVFYTRCVWKKTILEQLFEIILVFLLSTRENSLTIEIEARDWIS